MEYKNATLAQLRACAKEKGLRNITSLKKSELCELLENVDKVTNTSPAGVNATTEQTSRTENTQQGEMQSRTGSAQQEEMRGGMQREGVRSRSEGGARREGARVNGERTQSGYRIQNKTYERSQRADDERSQMTEQRSWSDGSGRIVNFDGQEYNSELNSGEQANGILEVMSDGYGFIRCENYLPGDGDIYVSPQQIRRFSLKTGDIISGPVRTKTQGEKFSALLYIDSVNGFMPSAAARRIPFEELTPIFPNERISLDATGVPVSIRIVDLLSPIGKGQRGMIVSPPKAGKTTLLKAIAKRISENNKDMHMIVLLIDERPEEVTDIRESIEGPNVEVIYSTFDELPEHHKRVSEMVMERAKRLVEHKQDVIILLDSITRLARAYNLTVPASGRTLSGGLDPAALHMPKKFFGAARNMREGGSLTILATALVETGSRMDDVVFEEFKGTGNMELVLDRKLSEKRIFPAIDINRSGTRRDDLLLNREEQEVVNALHKLMSGAKSEEITEEVLKLFVRTKNNAEFLEYAKKTLIKK